MSSPASRCRKATASKSITTRSCLATCGGGVTDDRISWLTPAGVGGRSGSGRRSGPRPADKGGFVGEGSAIPIGNDEREKDQRDGHRHQRDFVPCGPAPSGHAASPASPPRPAPSRVVRCARTQGTAPCLFPRGVLYSAGHPAEAGACVRAPMAGAPSQRRLEARSLFTRASISALVEIKPTQKARINPNPPITSSTPAAAEN